MATTRQFTCPGCNAPAVGKLNANGLVQCQFCGTSFQVSITPEQADQGRLLLGANFAQGTAPGWRLNYPDRVSFRPGELWAAFPASDLIHPVLSTPGHYDDVDFAATLRFIEGSYKHCYAGIEMRFTDDGDYTIHVSAQGTYRVGWHNKREWGETIMDWTTHPALGTEMGVPHRLRVTMHGDRLRIFLNGVLATSLRDSRCKAGSARLVVAPSKQGNVTVAFSQVELREVV